MPGAQGPQRGVASADFAGRAFPRDRLLASVRVDFVASPCSLLISSASCVCRCGFAMCMTAAPRLFASRCGRGARRSASRARARALTPVIPLSPFSGGVGRDRCEGLRARGGGRGEGQCTNAQRSSDGASTLWARFHSMGLKQVRQGADGGGAVRREGRRVGRGTGGGRGRRRGGGGGRGNS